MHAPRSAEALAPFPTQGEEEKEICQGQIHTDSGKARVEDQRKNARAECPAARSDVSKWKRNPDGHFLRKQKAIAKKVRVDGAELHRFRKTYADTLPEEGVSV